MGGRWATLAVRAQRDGILDYRTYKLGDTKWLLKEELLFASIEDSIQAEHCRLLMPLMDKDGRVDLFDKMLGYELPWVLKDIKEGNSSNHMVDMYKKAIMEQEKNGG